MVSLGRFIEKLEVGGRHGQIGVRSVAKASGVSDMRTRGFGNRRPLLDHQHIPAVFRQPSRGGSAERTAADHHNVTGFSHGTLRNIALAKPSHCKAGHRPGRS
jgi:hypothetical protein